MKQQSKVFVQGYYIRKSSRGEGYIPTLRPIWCGEGTLAYVLAYLANCMNMAYYNQPSIFACVGGKLERGMQQ